MMSSAQTCRLRVLCGTVILVFSGCGRDAELKPPVVRYGEDECAVCRMIVSDDRYAASIITLDARDRHEHLVFDDIGCMFEYEASRPDTPILARYVRHRSGESWLDAAQAEFVHSAEIHTPMAFGLAAVATLDEARELHEQTSGDLISLEEARRRFTAGTLHLSTLGGDAFNAALTSERTLMLEQGDEIRLSLASPQLLAPGSHSFDVRVERREVDHDWQPATELTLRIELEMPSMGHGSPNNEHPTHRGEGLYRGLTNFTMAGRWVVYVDIEERERPIGRTSFDFEVSR